MTFENFSQKLWPKCYFFHRVVSQVDQEKNHFFQKQKFEIGFLHLHIHGKL